MALGGPRSLTFFCRQCREDPSPALPEWEVPRLGEQRREVAPPPDPLNRGLTLSTTRGVKLRPFCVPMGMGLWSLTHCLLCSSRSFFFFQPSTFSTKSKCSFVDGEKQSHRKPARGVGWLWICPDLHHPPPACKGPAPACAGAEARTSESQQTVESWLLALP